MEKLHVTHVKGPFRQYQQGEYAGTSFNVSPDGTIFCQFRSHETKVVFAAGSGEMEVILDGLRTYRRKGKDGFAAFADVINPPKNGQPGEYADLTFTHAKDNTYSSFGLNMHRESGALYLTANRRSKDGSNKQSVSIKLNWPEIIALPRKFEHLIEAALAAESESEIRRIMEYREQHGQASEPANQGVSASSQPQQSGDTKAQPGAAPTPAGGFAPPPTGDDLPF